MFVVLQEQEFSGNRLSPAAPARAFNKRHVVMNQHTVMHHAYVGPFGLFRARSVEFRRPEEYVVTQPFLRPSEKIF